jgi:SAM-dependent methyltransferase
MRILNPRITADLDAGKPLKIDLGSGGPGRAGFYAVDSLELPGVDVLADLNEPLDLLPDDSVALVHSRHALEHVENLLPLMREIHRITRRDGVVEITVPHFSNVYGFSDPTHVRFFGVHSMSYFAAAEDQPSRRKVPAFYSDARFRIESIRIDFYRSSLADKLVGGFLSWFVNRNIRLQEFYERRLSGAFHAWQVRFVLRPVK